MAFAKNIGVKEQIDYPEVLFKQIDRIGQICYQPDINLRQFEVAVDILAAMVSFIEPINFKPTRNENRRYEHALAGFEKCISVMDKKGLLVRKTLGGQEFRYEQED